jgi:hypothetical protein
MARTMKTVTAKRTRQDVLVIEVNPLARGPRCVHRGGKHGSDKHPGRARSKRSWRRETAA